MLPSCKHVKLINDTQTLVNARDCGVYGDLFMTCKLDFLLKNSKETSKTHPLWTEIKQANSNTDGVLCRTINTSSLSNTFQPFSPAENTEQKFLKF